MRLILLILMVLFVSCKNQKKNSITQYCDLANDSKIWDVYDDSTSSFLVKGHKLDLINNNYRKIVSAINDKYPKPHIVIEKKINDTLFIKIDSTTEFTQLMGTNGALAYKAILIFSLTENDSIKCVFLDFEEGDHGGSPGFFTKKDFDCIFPTRKCD